MYPQVTFILAKAERVNGLIIIHSDNFKIIMGYVIDMIKYKHITYFQQTVYLCD